MSTAISPASFRWMKNDLLAAVLRVVRLSRTLQNVRSRHWMRDFAKVFEIARLTYPPVPLPRGKGNPAVALVAMCKAHDCWLWKRNWLQGTVTLSARLLIEAVQENRGAAIGFPLPDSGRGTGG